MGGPGTQVAAVNTINIVTLDYLTLHGYTVRVALFNSVLC